MNSSQRNLNLNIPELETGSDYEKPDIIARITNAEVQLFNQFRPFLTEQLQNDNLAIGMIYNTADRLKLKREKRPMFETNYFHDKLLDLGSNFRGNVPGVDIMGRTEDDHRRAEMFRDLNDYILHTGNDFTYEMSKAYLSAQIRRITWIKQEFNYISDEEGMVDISFYNKMLKFDTSMLGRDANEMQFISDDGWLSPEEIIQIYAKKNPDLAEEIQEKSRWIFGDRDTGFNRLATWSERVMNMTVDYSGESQGYDTIKLAADVHGNWWNDKGRLKVVDWYERRRFNTMVITDRLTGQQIDISDTIRVTEVGKDWYDNDLLQSIIQRYSLIESPHIEEDFTTKIYQSSVIPALNIVPYDGPQQLQNGNFKFTMVLCFDFHPDILQTKSMIDHTKDIVRLMNHADNTNMTYLGRAANGGVYVEESAVKGLENQATNKHFTILKDGAISKQRFKEKGVPPVNQANIQFQQQKSLELDRISASTPASRGIQESKQESGKLHGQKILQTEQMNEWASENAQSAGLQISENNVWYIQNFFSTERTFRIIHNQLNPYWLTINQKAMGEVLNDVSVGKYDVMISKTPYGRQAKEIERAKLDLMIERLMALDPRYVDPKLIVELYEPSKMDEWIKRIEFVEGIQQQELQAQIAKEQQEREANEENQLLGTESQLIQNEASSLQNEQLAGQMGMEQLLSGIMSQ